jgi:hypothetical protein
MEVLDGDSWGERPGDPHVDAGADAKDEHHALATGVRARGTKRRHDAA